MDNLINTIQALPGLKYTGGVSEQQILEAEKKLQLSFADDYRQYLLQFGQMQAKGIELTGISDKVLTSVVNATLAERKRKSFPKDVYVIEDLEIDGILCVQDSLGNIYEVAPGVKPLKISESLLQYIQSI